MGPLRSASRPAAPPAWSGLRGSCLLTALVVLSAGTAAGCAHQQWSNGVLHKAGRTVRLGPVPAAWSRIQVEGADAAFRDSAREGSALFDVACGYRDNDAPLSVLTEHLIMGTTERRFDSQDVIPFDGREAMHSLLDAKLDGVPMRYDIYVLKKDGCVYDLVYVAPPDRFADGSADFQRFASGLQVSSDP